MSNKKFKIGFFVLLGLLLMVVLPNVEATIYFSDDFNRGNDATVGGGWTLVSGTIVNITDNRLHVDPGGNIELSNSSFGGITPSYMRFEIESSLPTNGDGVEMRLNDGASIGPRIGGWSYAGNIQYYNGATWPECYTPINADTRYNITVYNIDWTTYTFNISVNDVWACNGDFSSDISSMTKIHLYHGGSEDGIIHYDNFCLSDGEDCFPSAPAEPDTLNITATYPANNTQFNTQQLEFHLNLSTSRTFNVSLYINDTLNQTLTGITAGTSPVRFNVSFPLDDESSYSYYFSGITNNTQENSTTNYFFIDNVNPVLAWTVPTKDNSWVVSATNLTSNILATDNNLYSYEYNISWANNNSVIYNVSNTSLTGLTSRIINHSFDLSSYGGVLNVTAKVCDGHTANNINFNANVEGKQLHFDNQKVKIYQENTGDTKNVNYLRGTDRYSFEFETINSGTSKTFIVESDQYIDILEGTGYLGHLVTGNKWIDFEEFDATGVNLIRLSDTKVRVVIFTDIGKTKWKFNSIGELNCITESTTVFSAERAYSFTTPILAGQLNTYRYNISYNSSWITSIDTDLWYNGTEYSMTESCSSTLCQYSRTLNAAHYTDNISVIFEYEINGEFANDSQTQEVFLPSIDNCVANPTRFVNYTIRDELTDAAISGNVSYLFEWTSGTYTGKLNSSETGANYYDFCSYPSFGNFTTDVILQYSSDGYDTRDYVVDNFIVDSVMDTINLFLLSTGLSTEVTLHVRDDADADLQNVFIEAYRWDIPTDTDKLVETEYTDSDGNAIFDLKTGSEYYSFKFYQGGILQLETTRFKIFSTTLEYTLSEQVTTRISENLRMQTIDATISYNNNTKVVTFTWDDQQSVADNYCFLVTDSNTTYYYECSTTTSSSLNFTLPAENNTYYASGLGRYADTDRYYTLIDKTINLYRTWQRILGIDNSIMVSFIVHLTITLLFLSSVNAVIIGNIASIIILSLFSLSPFSIEIVIGIAALGLVLLWLTNRRREV